MARWTNLPTKSGTHIVRLDKGPDKNAAAALAEFTFVIWFSDLKSLWCETITSQELFKRFSDENPGFVVGDDEVIKGQLIAAIDTAANTKNPEVLHNDDGDTKLNLKYVIFGDFEVGFQWSLKKCDSSVFFEQMTKVFLRQIGELEDQKKQLIDMLKKKDDEIGQYKLKHGSIDRKRFITAPFEEKQFEMQTNAFSGVIDQLESAIGLVPKNVATTAVKQTIPRGKRRIGSPFFNRAPIVRAGQYQYDDDDDDEDNGSDIGSKQSSIQVHPVGSTIGQNVASEASKTMVKIEPKNTEDSECMFVDAYVRGHDDTVTEIQDSPEWTHEDYMDHM